MLATYLSLPCRLFLKLLAPTSSYLPLVLPSVFQQEYVEQHLVPPLQAYELKSEKGVSVINLDVSLWIPPKFLSLPECLYFQAVK